MPSKRRQNRSLLEIDALRCAFDSKITVRDDCKRSLRQIRTKCLVCTQSDLLFEMNAYKEVFIRNEFNLPFEINLHNELFVCTELDLPFSLGEKCSKISAMVHLIVNGTHNVQNNAHEITSGMFVLTKKLQKCRPKLLRLLTLPLPSRAATNKSRSRYHSYTATNWIVGFYALFNFAGWPSGSKLTNIWFRRTSD